MEDLINTISGLKRNGLNPIRLRIKRDNVFRYMTAYNIPVSDKIKFMGLEIILI